MNRLTARQKEWLWFAALWTGGLCAALTVGGVIKLALYWMRLQAV